MLDIVVMGKSGPELAVEFKYHREGLSTLPKPQRAGGIASDLFRLAYAQAVWKCEALFVYVSDESMLSYLRQPRHGLAETLFSAPGQEIPIGIATIAGRNKTFLTALNGFVSPAVVTCLREFHLTGSRIGRIYRVRHIPDPAYEYD